MSLYPVVMPLMRVTGGLVQAVQTDATRCQQAATLRACCFELDNQLQRTVVAEELDGETYYQLNLKQLEPSEFMPLAKDIFELCVPLQNDVRNELSGIARVVATMADAMKKNLDGADGPVHDVAQIDKNGHVVLVNNVPRSFETCLIFYLGVSPFAVFGDKLDYDDPEIAADFYGFGFGPFVSLSLALEPEIARDGVLPPAIEYGGIKRPVFRMPLTVGPDASFDLSHPLAKT